MIARPNVVVALLATASLAGCFGNAGGISSSFVPAADRAIAPSAATSVMLDVRVPPVPLSHGTAVRTLVIEADGDAATRTRLKLQSGSHCSSSGGTLQCSIALPVLAGTHVLKFASLSSTGARLAQDHLVVNVADCQANTVSVALYESPHSIDVASESNYAIGSQSKGFEGFYGSGRFAVALRDAGGEAIVGPLTVPIDASSSNAKVGVSVVGGNTVLAKLPASTTFDRQYKTKISVSAGTAKTAFAFTVELTTWPTPTPAASPSPCGSMDRMSALRSSQKTGVLVPLYVYPGKIWNAVIRAKLEHPQVPFVLIANVNSGPGSAPDPKYVRFIEMAQKAGIYVLGYVDTNYGKRSTTTVETDIANWEAFYRPDGVFLDRMATDAASFYTALTQYAHGHSLWFVMGNPGVDAPGSSGPDVINFYERAGYPSLAFLRKPAHRAYGKSRWSYIAGAVAFNASRVRASAAYVGFLFATDGKEPECYCRLPSYFGQLVTLLAKQ